MAAAAAPARQRRRILVTAMIVLATLLGVLAIAAVWLNRQALNTDNWATSSSQLLESPAVRTALSAYLVDQAYSAYDVPAELRRVLPPRAQPLAAPAASGLRDLAEKGVDTLLQRPRVQGLWEEANRRAHQRLMQVLDDGSGAVSTQNGTVVLDLGTLLGQAAGGIGVAQRIAAKVPPGAGQITILHSNQLATAQDAVALLRKLPLLLLALALGLYAGAVALAGGWRREALRSVGIGLLVAGAAGLLIRTLAGNAVVDALAPTAAARPAAQDVWTIASSQLGIAAQATLLYGVFVILAAWLAGPTRVAVGARTAMAPYLPDARYAFGGAALLLLLLIWWGPTPATRNPVALLVFAGLIALGVELLRREVAREHPGASTQVAAEQRRAWLARTRERMSGAVGRVQVRHHAGSAGAAEEGSRLDTLERLGRLHGTGVLDDAEFAAEKQRLLGREPGRDQ
jgi:hypothetical protein